MIMANQCSTAFTSSAMRGQKHHGIKLEMASRLTMNIGDRQETGNHRCIAKQQPAPLTRRVALCIGDDRVEQRS